MQKLQINQPKKIERQIDEFINSDPEGKFIFRLCTLKMFLQDPGCTAESLGKLMKLSPRSVANWIHSINAGGDIEVLRDREKTGRRNRLNEGQLELLKGCLQKHPSESGVDANIWDGKALSHFIERKFGVVLQVRQCQRLFSKLGFSLKRGRTVVASGDAIAKKAFKKTPGDKKKEGV
jgi:transposase